MLERQDDIATIELPTGDEVGVHRLRFGIEDGPRAAVVAAVRGDTPEGTRVAHLVVRHLRAHVARLRGRVDVFPCTNPLAAHHGSRNWPGFDVDLHRRFPGRPDGHAPDRVAHALLAELRGLDQVIELRGAHPAFREETQAHVRADQADAVERAMGANVRVVRLRTPELGNDGSLGAQLPGLICLDGGTGTRLDDHGKDLADGVCNMLAMLGILPDDALPFHWAALTRPVAATDEEVLSVRSTRGGVFLPGGQLWAAVAEGEPLGEVVDPLTGEIREVVTAPAAGHLLARREQPAVYPGSLVARLVVE